MKNVWKWIRTYKYEIIVGVFITLYIGYFSVASILRYTNFYTGRFDLGNMDQVVWNTTNGRFFQLTDPDGTSIISRLAVHADFLLILLAPFYYIWQDPQTLLILQAVVLGLGGIFVYLIARHVLNNKLLACTLTIVYLFNPSLQNSNLYDFHAVTFATTFFLAAWYFLLRKNYWWVILFLLLSGLTKEEAWIPVGMMFFYIAYRSARKIFWITLAIACLVLAYFLVSYAIPHVRGSQHFALSYYADFGNSPAQIIKTLLISPQKFLLTVITPSKLYYLFQLTFPLGMLSLLSPLYLLFALPDLGVNLLSSNSQLHQIFFQYTAIITPFLFISAIYGLRNLFLWFPKLSISLLIHRTMACYLLLVTLIAVFTLGPLPGSRSQNVMMFTTPLKNSEAIDAFLRRIPAKYSIAATNTVGSHLSHRQKIFTIPTGIKDADIVVFLFNDADAQPSPKAQQQMAEDLKKDPSYDTVYADNEFAVFAKENVHVQFRPTPRKKFQSPLFSSLSKMLFLPKGS